MDLVLRTHLLTLFNGTQTSHLTSGGKVTNWQLVSPQRNPEISITVPPAPVQQREEDFSGPQDLCFFLVSSVIH